MAPAAALNPLAVARHVASVLDEDGLPYALGGALALGAWGAPRATQDVDMTVFAREAEADRVFDALERAGLIFDRAACRQDLARIGMFKARAGRMVIDVFLAGHPQYEAMAARRVAVDDGAGGRLVFISAEDLTLHKLIFGRPKDVLDLERLFAVRRALDLDYVRGWLRQMVPSGDVRLELLEDLARRFPRA